LAQIGTLFTPDTILRWHRLLVARKWDYSERRQKKPGRPVLSQFGGTMTSVYDAANRLTSRQFGGSGQTPLRIDLGYNNRNQMTTETRFTDLAGTNKIGSTTLTYDGVGRLTNLQHFNGSMTILANYTYTYDLASKLTTEVLNGTTTTYQYDTTNQLTNDTAKSYSYDLNGNRTMTGYQTGGNNQMTNDGTWTYTYDQEGNLIKKSKGSNADTWTFGYDNLNHLLWAKDSATDGGSVNTLATYVYDVFGNRIEKDVWTSTPGTTTVTRFAYDGKDLWADLNGSNALLTRYIHGDVVDQLFARISGGGTAAWYLTDRLGSVRDITDNTGAVIDHINYDGFGNVTTETQPSNGDRWKWTGREFEGETGLQYNRARYYDPKTGRWISQDPIGFIPGDSNLYRYVRNNPIITTDPQGLDSNQMPDKAKYINQMKQLIEEENQSIKAAVDRQISRARSEAQRQKVLEEYQAALEKAANQRMDELMRQYMSDKYKWDIQKGDEEWFYRRFGPQFFQFLQKYIDAKQADIRKGEELRMAALKERMKEAEKKWQEELAKAKEANKERMLREMRLRQLEWKIMDDSYTEHELELYEQFRKNYEMKYHTKWAPVLPKLPGQQQEPHID
jgi:RHS repeat-associated protein